jgi:hypothetical protein
MRRILLSSLLLSALSACAAVAGDWTETVVLNGDLRYRHEMIDKDGSELRNRQRIRARLNLGARLDERFSLGFGLVSGSDDPVSTNQTLDDAFATKPVMLDRAFFTWKHASGLKIVGGKMGTPFHRPGKTELIWDSDLSPEGLAASATAGDGATKFFVNAAGLWIDERSSAENASLTGAQVGLTHKLDGAWFTLGGSYFGYDKLTGALYDGDFFGNSNDGSTFATGFKLLELFAEAGFKAGDTPVAVYVDFVTNSEADADEQGYLFGATLGKAKQVGSWQLGWNYRELQKDAVVGAFTNSDITGGGTDLKGHQLGFGYQVAPQAQFALTYFLSKVGVENGVDYGRLQADMNFKF